MNPLISVILPTYNRANLLANAINSVLNQTFDNFELIIVDDGSIDETEKLVKKLKDTRIKYLKLESNFGVAKARNFGLQNIKGNYIAFLDSDDEFLPLKLQLQLKTAISLNRDVFIFCNGFCNGEDKKYAWDLSINNGFIDFKKNIFPLRISIPPPSSWFFSKNIFKNVGYFDESIYVWDDLDYLLRIILSNYPVYFLNELVVKWHKVDDHLYSISTKLVEGKERFLSKHFDMIKKDKYYLFRFYSKLGKECLSSKDYKKAKKYFKEAFKLKPYKIEVFFKFLQVHFKKDVYY